MGRDYAETRNHDYGPGRRDNVSMLSPYIRHRLLSEEEAVRAAIGYHGARNAEKFVQEIFWRTYWKGWLEQRPSVWSDYLGQVSALQKVRSAELGSALAARTGIDCFDHWVRELMETGYLHNHARMWFASIWIFTLRLPWQLGADFFLDHLLDGDPASNTLSWRWVAGLQTIGKHYVADADNIRRFTAGRFHPVGLNSSPQPLPAWPPPVATPVPRVNALPDGELALVLTEEDLTPDLPANVRNRITALVVAPLAQNSVALVRAFREKALRSAGDQLGAELNVPIVAPRAWQADEWRDLLAPWPGISLVTAYPPVGPLQSALTDIGLGISMFRRPWDDVCWPYARKGFFQFKEHIPAILEATGIL
jgi:deoxyribodipyrimidine photo-lyase